MCLCLFIVHFDTYFVNMPQTKKYIFLFQFYIDCFAHELSSKHKFIKSGSVVSEIIVSKCLKLSNKYQFSIPRIEYPLGGSSKKGSHVYFLLQVLWVIILFCHKSYSDSTMVT